MRQEDQESGWSGLADILAGAGTGLLRATLLFGAAAAALALALAPAADRRAQSFIAERAGLDMIATGSVPGDERRYVLRRSVLQAPGSAPCILFSNGKRRGSC